jgi:hypothetical protein
MELRAKSPEGLIRTGGRQVKCGGSRFNIPSRGASSHTSSMLRERRSLRNGHEGHCASATRLTRRVPWLCVPLSREVCPYRLLIDRRLLHFSTQVNGDCRTPVPSTNSQPPRNRECSTVHTPFTLRHRTVRLAHLQCRRRSTNPCDQTVSVQQPFGNLIEPRARPRRREEFRRWSWAGGR